MPDTFIGDQLVDKLQEPSVKRATQKDCPNYWNADPKALLSESHVSTVAFGTGRSIYKSTICPAILGAEFEIILVTCFWASSGTLDDLSDTLRSLSAKSLRRKRKTRVRVCFSSSSILQKLLHSPSLHGQDYPPSKWKPRLGLPDPEELQGLDFQVKSVFLLPFSVMHPKFVLIDRQRVFMPSCNVSWENWFEGCFEMTGPIVSQFLSFWMNFWANEEDKRLATTVTDVPIAHDITNRDFTGNLLASKHLGLQDVPSIFLPSPHHRNPNFQLPFLWYPSAPPTPLNVYLIETLQNAEKAVYIQTPNITAKPAISAVVSALKRGVNVTIVTSDRLMILEQLITAWTTTSRCIKSLTKQHQILLSRSVANADDVESGIVPQLLGSLRVRLYRPSSHRSGVEVEPDQSHLKITIVDERITVFGSGNMDRASWYTSQELDVAFDSPELASKTKECLDQAMSERSIEVYNS